MFQLIWLLRNLRFQKTATDIVFLPRPSRCLLPSEQDIKLSTTSPVPYFPDCFHALCHDDNRLILKVMYYTLLWNHNPQINCLPLWVPWSRSLHRNRTVIITVASIFFFVVHRGRHDWEKLDIYSAFDQVEIVTSHCADTVVRLPGNLVVKAKRHLDFSIEILGWVPTRRNQLNNGCWVNTLHT